MFATPDTNPQDLGFGIPTGTANGAWGRQIQVTGRIQF